MRSAIIVIGGSPPPPAALAGLPPDPFVIAADSGYDHARALGLAVDLLVGDLDSISAAGRAEAEASGITMELHPTDKDATDTELALDAATARGHRSLTVLSGGGDRIDHLLATVFALAAPKRRDCSVEMWWGTTLIQVRHGRSSAPLGTAPGELFSLLPVHGAATAVDIAGAAFPLVAHSLEAGSSLGISNLADPTRPTLVGIGAGSILVIRPYALGGNP